jgi:hypothetical protein
MAEYRKSQGKPAPVPERKAEDDVSVRHIKRLLAAAGR